MFSTLDRVIICTVTVILLSPLFHGVQSSQLAQHKAHNRPHRPQRVIGRNPLLRRYIRKKISLILKLPAHNALALTTP